MSRCGFGASTFCSNSLLPRLRATEYPKVLIVTQPEATPAHETERRQNDLAGDVEPAFAALAKVTAQCVACHAGYRIE